MSCIQIFKKNRPVYCLVIWNKIYLTLFFQYQNCINLINKTLQNHENFTVNLLAQPQKFYPEQTKIQASNSNTKVIPQQFVQIILHLLYIYFLISHRIILCYITIIFLITGKYSNYVHNMQSQPNNSSIRTESQSQESIKQKNSKPKNRQKNDYRIIINVSDCQYIVVNKVAKALNWKIQNSAEATDWDVCWTDNAVQPEILSKMEQHQKINHFPGMFNLARKNLMGRGLMRMRKKFPEDYSFFPMTWMLPVQYHELKAYFETKQKGKARTFIVKPQASSQGRGIFLTRKLQDIDQNEHCVVQRYLHKPYLIQGLKFDLRIYVLLAGVQPLRLYIYQQGLGRFATELYETPNRQNIQDTCMHLTNYAINKDNPNFIFNQTEKDMTKGHKRSLTAVYDLLRQKGANVEHLKQTINQIIVKTILSGLPHLVNTYKACQPQNFANDMCFELLGFDIMLTDKLQPILLEINHTPSFSIDTPLDKHIKNNFIKDSLVLMNINQKKRNNIIKAKKQACKQRIITGKKQRLPPQQKQRIRDQLQRQRDKYEKKHLGAFTSIYPIQDQKLMSEYKKFYDHAHDCYLIQTGSKKPIKPDKVQHSSQRASQKVVEPQKSKIMAFSTRKTQQDFVKANIMMVKTKEKRKTIIQSKILQSNKEISLLQNPTTPDLHLSEQFEPPVQELSEKIQTNLKNKKPSLEEEFQYNKPCTNIIRKSNIKNAGFKFQTKSNTIAQVVGSFQTMGRIDIGERNGNQYKYNLFKNHFSSEKDFRQYQIQRKQQETYKKKNLGLAGWKQKSGSGRQYQAFNKDKIPIMLNTLLINGVQSSALSINNLKKVINTQKY